jgi:hypothetical protein
VTIPRNGDLITTLFLEVVLTKHASAASYYPAEHFVKEVDIEIGGQRVDKLYNDSMRLFSELYHTPDEKQGYRRLTDFSDSTAGGHPGSKERFFVPINFWFTRASGLALPLVALQYHEVRLNLLFASAAEMALNGVDSTVTPEATLYATYVYLDSAERKRFSQNSHEYLVTVLQHTGPESIAPGTTSKTANYRLNFNHPCRTLWWAIRDTTKYGKFTTSAPGTTDDRYAPIQSVKLQLNGHDRFEARSGKYFNAVQPFEHIKGSFPAAGVYMYSFCLKPDEIVQPSGSCNMSRIDNASLIVTTKAGSVAYNDEANILDENMTLANVEGNLTSLLVFAESMNVLRILSGMGGLAYSS